MAGVNPSRIKRPRIVQTGWKQRLLAWVPAVALILAWSWFVFDFGRQRAGFDIGVVSSYERQVEAEIALLKKQRSGLRREVARLRRSSQVDREAAKKVQGELGRMQASIADLKKENALLGKLLAGGSGALYVQSVTLAEVKDKPSAFDFKLVLAQALRHVGLVRGRVYLTVKGKQGGKSADLKLKALTSGEHSSLALHFRYKQSLEQRLTLPAGFKPGVLVLDVRPSSGSLKRVKRTYEWQRALR